MLLETLIGRIETLLSGIRGVTMEGIKVRARVAVTELRTPARRDRFRKKIKSRHLSKHRRRLAKAQKPRTPHVLHERGH